MAAIIALSAHTRHRDDPVRPAIPAHSEPVLGVRYTDGNIYISSISSAQCTLFKVHVWNLRYNFEVELICILCCHTDGLFYRLYLKALYGLCVLMDFHLM